MKLTTRQKTLVAVLGTAMLFLVYDQIHSRSTTPELSTQADGAVPAMADTMPTASVTDSGPALLIAQRLRNLRSSVPAGQGVANAFAPLSGMSAGAALVDAASTTQLKLTGVMFTDSAKYAVINGRPVRVGETIGGYRLMSVSRNAAQFRFGQDVLTLTLVD